MSYIVLGWCFFSKNYILNDSLQKVADEKRISGSQVSYVLMPTLLYSSISVGQAV